MAADESSRIGIVGIESTVRWTSDMVVRATYEL